MFKGLGFQCYVFSIAGALYLVIKITKRKALQIMGPLKCPLQSAHVGKLYSMSRLQFEAKRSL